MGKREVGKGFVAQAQSATLFGSKTLGEGSIIVAGLAVVILAVAVGIGLAASAVWNVPATLPIGWFIIAFIVVLIVEVPGGEDLLGDFIVGGLALFNLFASALFGAGYLLGLFFMPTMWQAFIAIVVLWFIFAVALRYWRTRF